MNHCHDCNSDYATPGTCNCFAPGGKRYLTPTAPYYPWGVYPLYPSYPIWYWNPNTTTVTVGDTIGGGSCGATFAGSDGSVTSGSISLQSALAFSGAVSLT